MHHTVAEVQSRPCTVEYLTTVVREVIAVGVESCVACVDQRRPLLSRVYSLRYLVQLGEEIKQA